MRKILNNTELRLIFHFKINMSDFLFMLILYSENGPRCHILR